MKCVYCWACDFSKNSGEGNLANLFVNKKFNNNYKIYTPDSLNINQRVSNIINYKYISPLIGVIFCWFFFIKNKRVAYISYLPLWNFLIFAQYLTKKNQNFKIICIGGSIAIASGEEKPVPTFINYFEFLWRLRYETLRRIARLFDTFRYFIYGKFFIHKLEFKKIERQ